MYFEDEEEKRRRQMTAQYINTPYGPARNPELEEKQPSANPYEIENPPQEKADYLGIVKNYAPKLGFLPEKDGAFNNAVQAYQSFKKDKVYNDKYKHATVSCIGAQGTPLDTFFTAAGGTAKEMYDIVNKSKEKAFGNNQYKSYADILKDSREDLKADFQGIRQGVLHPNENCEEWMKRYYYPYWK